MHTLAWYDLIPILSWVLLKGTCRYCHKPISWLYPLVELITPLCIAPLFYLYQLETALAYMLFFSALIVNVRTDLESMLLVRIMTLGMIPVGLLASAMHVLPITVTESITGTLLGYGVLYCVKTIFFKLKKVDGMGQGDLELLAMIGSFLGPIHTWMTLVVASTCGACVGIALLICGKGSRSTALPFGPFLALGAYITTLFLLYAIRSPF